MVTIVLEIDSSVYHMAVDEGWAEDFQIQVKEAVEDIGGIEVTGIEMGEV